jgi:hypothetical protein
MAMRICLLLLLICSASLSGEKALKSKEAAKEPVPEQNSILKNIKPATDTIIKIPPEYESGFYLNKDLLIFGAPDGIFEDSIILEKYIICNRQGEVVKEFEKVLFWNGGEYMLKLNAASSLIYINLLTGEQQIIKIDFKNLSAIRFNPFHNTIIYTLGWENQIHEYDLLDRSDRILAKLASGNLSLLFPVSPNEIIYARPKITTYYKNQYDDDPYVNLELPLFLINLKYYKEAELTKISRSGVLFHFNQEKKELLFIVEEKGFFKVFSSNDLLHPKQIKVSQLNRYSKDGYDGLILHYGAMNPECDLLAFSRIKLTYKNASKASKFAIFNIKSENFSTEAGEIYLLDLHGNSKQITNSQDKIEVVCDWSPDGDEILYFDYKNNNFHIMELDLQGVFNKKILQITPENLIVLNH